MNVDEQLQERVRRAGAILADAVPPGVGFDELADVHLARVERPNRLPGSVAFGTAFVVVFVLGIVGWVLVDRSDNSQDDVAVSAPATVDSPEMGPVGIPVSDDEFTDAVGPEPGMVPGTARLVAEREIPGMGVYKVFTVEVNYIDKSQPFDSPTQCVLGPSGGVCPGEISDFGINAGASCSPSPVMTVTVQGLLGADMTAIFHLTDGTTQEIAPENGIAIWAWDATHGIENITVTNATPTIADQLSKIDGSWFPELPYYTCTE